MTEVDDLKAENERLKREFEQLQVRREYEREGHALLVVDHERLKARAGEFADFINKVTVTLPRDHALANEARDLLRDGLYGGKIGLPKGWEWWKGIPPEAEDEDRRVLCAASREGYTVEVWNDGEDYLCADGASFRAVEAVIARRRTGADDARQALRPDRNASEEQEVPTEVSFEEALDHLLLECQAVEELEWDSEGLTQYCGEPFGKSEFIEGSMTKISFEVVEDHCRRLQARMGDGGERLAINWRLVAEGRPTETKENMAQATRGGGPGKLSAERDPLLEALQEARAKVEDGRTVLGIADAAWRKDNPPKPDPPGGLGLTQQRRMAWKGGFVYGWIACLAELGVEIKEDD